MRKSCGEWDHCRKSCMGSPIAWEPSPRGWNAQARGEDLEWPGVQEIRKERGEKHWANPYGAWAASSSCPCLHYVLIMLLTKKGLSSFQPVIVSWHLFKPQTLGEPFPRGPWFCSELPPPPGKCCPSQPASCCFPSLLSLHTMDWHPSVQAGLGADSERDYRLSVKRL